MKKIKYLFLITCLVPLVSFATANKCSVYDICLEDDRIIDSAFTNPDLFNFYYNDITSDWNLGFNNNFSNQFLNNEIGKSISLMEFRTSDGREILSDYILVPDSAGASNFFPLFISLNSADETSQDPVIFSDLENFFGSSMIPLPCSYITSNNLEDLNNQSFNNLLQTQYSEVFTYLLSSIDDIDYSILNEKFNNDANQIMRSNCVKFLFINNFLDQDKIFSLENQIDDSVLFDNSGDLENYGGFKFTYLSQMYEYDTGTIDAEGKIIYDRFILPPEHLQINNEPIESSVTWGEYTPPATNPPTTNHCMSIATILNPLSTNESVIFSFRSLNRFLNLFKVFSNEIVSNYPSNDLLIEFDKSEFVNCPDSGGLNWNSLDPNVFN